MAQINKPVHVLMIDDDEDDAVLTESIFQQIETYQFEIDYAPTYEAGIRLIHEKEHDLYFVDYRLERRNGLDFMKEALQYRPEGLFIILTGLNEHRIDSEATQLGAFDYLVKGKFDEMDLERTIRHALERARVAKELKGVQKSAEEARRLQTGSLTRIEQECRVPVNEILNLSELLLNNPADNQQKKHLESIHQSAQNLMALLNHIVNS